VTKNPVELLVNHMWVV